MKTSLLVFATDLVDEGIETVLTNVQERAGADEVTLAVAYHSARDVFPHNPVRKVRYLEGGAVFFAPQWSRYKGLRLKPHPSELVGSDDPLGDLCEVAEGRDMSVNAWAVYLHSDRLGFDHPECATQNAFGDRYLTDLCPANPDVRAYARALTSDIVSYGVSNIFAESLHFHGLGHGYHHERYFEELGTVGTYLLGLCFCGHCLEVARLSGVDVELVHRRVRDELALCFEGEQGCNQPEELTREVLEPFGGGQLLGYIEARIQTVTSLAEEISAASGENTNVAFLDLSGAEKGFTTGEPTGEASIKLGWQNGVEVAALKETCDTITVTGYAADPARLALDLGAYRSVVSDAARLGVLLRPMPPDCRSADNLAGKVKLVRELGLGRVDFYHYGFCRLRALDWIRQSLMAT
jgi:hypothetical protein